MCKEREQYKEVRGEKSKRVSPTHHRVSLQMHKCAAVAVQVLVRVQLYAFAPWFIPAKVTLHKKVYRKSQCYGGVFTWRYTHSNIESDRKVLFILFYFYFHEDSMTFAPTYALLVGVNRRRNPTQVHVELVLKNVPQLEDGANVYV